MPYLDGLPVAASVSGVDVLAVDQGGTPGRPGTATTRQATLAQVLQLGTGPITGPGSSINGNAAAFNGTTGKVLQDAGYHVESGIFPLVEAATLAAASALLRAPYGEIWLTDFGADPSGATPCDAQFIAFVSAVMTSGRPGYVPPGNYTFASAATIDFGLATGGSARISGVLNRSILNFAAVSASPSLTVADLESGRAAFYGLIEGISVHGNCAGPLVQIGDAAHASAFNGFVFNMEIKNNSTSTSAVGLQVDGAENCLFNCTSNCAGHGTSLVCNQMAFCTVQGSYSGADTGVYLTAFFSFGNVFLNLDIEVVNTCVQIDATNAGRNTFIGGQFAWTNGSGSPVAAINATAGNQTRFIGVNFASIGSVFTGSTGIIIYGAASPVGTEIFGGLAVVPGSGDADIVLQAAASGVSANVVMNTGTALRWTAGKNNGAESGANAGSNFVVTRYNDAGAAIDNPLVIARSTGLTEVSALSSQGAGAFWGSSLPSSRPTITGSRSAATAGVLGLLLTALAATGLIIDGTTA